MPDGTRSVTGDEAAARAGGGAGAPRNKRVVIAGAGVAGLAAAHVLSAAGFEVTVLDKADAPGGRCMSYVDPELGHTVEHGIHGVFPRYDNLRALFREIGIDGAVYTRTKTTGVPAPGGRMRSTELAGARGPAPLFLMKMVPSGVLRLTDYLLSLPFLMQTYASRRMAETLDDDTFAAMLRDAGVPGRMARLLLVPYVKNLSYARGDEVSARVATEALDYYVLENADDVKAAWLDGGMVPLIFEPWKRALEARGVRFRMGVPVQSILFDGDHRFVAFATRAMISDRELEGAPPLFTRQLGDTFVGVSWDRAAKRLRVFDAKCTHQGCRVGVGSAGGTPIFECPCHGGQFDAEGQVLRAPPQRPLAPVPMRHEDAGGVWVVDGEGAGGPDAAPAGAPPDDGLERADYAVLAMDLASLKAVFPRRLSLDPSTAGVPLLRTTSVTVMRMRFAARPGKPKWSGPDTGVFAADDALDNFFALHTMQREFAAHDDLFLECHIGNSESFGALEDDDIFDLAARVLDAYFPDEELGRRMDRKRSRILRHVDVFPLFAPGDHERTPTVSDPRRPDVMLAGDWVRTDDPENRSFFMERAAVTGIEAANAILRAEGAGPDAERPILRRGPALASRVLAAPVLAWEAARRVLRRALGVAE
jgi:uncharacterized protein with NAD-binding domain and iron-sulfur cluster/nitrite reductase/ring-hydroxylating ferredoxin subunit